MGFEDLDIGKQPEKKEVVLDTKQLEPGNKLPVGEYLQIGQWCDTCNDVEAHAYSKRTKKIRCLKCKTTRQL